MSDPFTAIAIGMIGGGVASAALAPRPPRPPQPPKVKKPEPAPVADKARDRALDTESKRKKRAQTVLTRDADLSAPQTGQTTLLGR